MRRGLEQAAALPAPPPPPPPKPQPEPEWKLELQRRLGAHREKTRLPPLGGRPLSSEPADTLPPPTSTRPRLALRASAAQLSSPHRPSSEPVGDTSTLPPPPAKHRPPPPIVDMRPLRDGGLDPPPSQAPPAAAPVHLRMVAGLMDLGVALLSTGLFAGTVHLIQGASLQGEEAVQVLAAAFCLILLFYWFSFTRYIGITAGMSWLGLRLVNFDGQKPNEAQRRTRAFGVALSAAALGIGFAWAAADEQRLTWHDRLSKTFVARRRAT